MIPFRFAEEVTHQLSECAEHERLANILAQPSIFVTCWRNDRSSLLSFWKKLTEQGFAPEPLYQQNLISINRGQLAFESRKLLSDFFTHRGQFDASISVSQELLHLAEEQERLADIATAAGAIGGTNIQRGTLDGVMPYLERSLELSRKIGDRRREATAISNICIVHWWQSRFDQAMQYAELQLQICKEIQFTQGMAAAIGNTGFIHALQSRYDQALAAFENQYTLLHSIGDHRGMSLARSSIGNVYYEQGRLDDALKEFEEHLEASEMLGDEASIATASGHIGKVLGDQGKFDEGYKCYDRQIELCERTGDKIGLSVAYSGIANILVDQGRYNEALGYFLKDQELSIQLGDQLTAAITVGNIAVVNENIGKPELAQEGYESALAEHRRLGYTYGVTEWLCHLAVLALEKSRSAECKQYAHEARSISSELQKQNTLYLATILIARSHAVEGKVDEAVQGLRELIVSVSNDEGAVARWAASEATYWLWKITGDAEYRFNAEDRFQLLYDSLPKFDYRKRIAELRGERVPMSAGDLEAEA